MNVRSVLDTHTSSAELASRYQGGQSLEEIADAMATSPSTVRRQLLAAGVELRPAGTPRRRPDRDTLQRHLAARLIRAQIADRYGVGCAAVSNWLTRTGLRPATPPRPTIAELHRLYIQEELTLREIGDQLHVTKQAVGGWLADAGIPTRERPTHPAHGSAALICQMYVDEQLSCAQIGQQLRSSSATIARVLQRNQIPRRRPQPPALTRPQLETGLDQGMTATEIARQHGCSVSAACRALKREGLETTRQARTRTFPERSRSFDKALSAMDRQAST